MFLGALLIVSMAVSAQIDSLEQNLPWPQNMQSRLDSMMRDTLLDCTHGAIIVWDLTEGRSLFSMNHRQRMRPASTMKLLTAITALDYLGTDHKFTTSLYYKGTITDGTLVGDVICVGGMDPAFSTDDMKMFATQLQQKGIKSIKGRLVADISMKDTLKWGEGWCWDDDNPTLSPLLVNRKPDFLRQLAKSLSDKGISLKGAQRVSGPLPDSAVLVCRRQHSIDQILLRTLKDSDNLYAEAIYYQIAARYAQQHEDNTSNKRSQTTAKALYAQLEEKALLERAGLPSERYRLADGSGLSLYNYITAECLLHILRYAYEHKQIYKHLLPALPVAGEDGTLKRRMIDTAAQGNVQAKTGTVTGVSSLAGYCTASNGHRLCFAIINQGIQRSSHGRDYQDKICQILCE